ncbi:unnamed protein product [Prorocentrum cordatum]|uniref:Uncharacterized protein n=1 Tax=Prorocentrum cordatum TaxID=2364126 RepID=A0ABN9U585_9DINO|nr:unnamed protein product [Polarella glacialis]
MNRLASVPELQRTMQEMRVEMARAEVVDDMMEEFYEESDDEREIDAEVQKVMDELVLDRSQLMAGASAGGGMRHAGLPSAPVAAPPPAHPHQIVGAGDPFQDRGCRHCRPGEGPAGADLAPLQHACNVGAMAFLTWRAALAARVSRGVRPPCHRAWDPSILVACRCPLTSVEGCQRACKCAHEKYTLLALLGSRRAVKGGRVHRHTVAHPWGSTHDRPLEYGCFCRRTAASS